MRIQSIIALILVWPLTQDLCTQKIWIELTRTLDTKRPFRDSPKGMRFLGAGHGRKLHLILPPLLHISGVVRVPVLVAEHIPVSGRAAMALIFFVVI